MNRFISKALSSAFVLVSLILSGCFVDTSNSSTTPQVEYSQTAVDSLFAALILRVEEAADSVEFYDGDIDTIAGLEFQDLATEFNKYVSSGNIKANIGFIVAEMASLNKSKSLKKLADSLDIFFSQYSPSTVIELNESPTPVKMPTIGVDVAPVSSNTISRAYSQNGVNGMALSLLASTPRIVRATSVSSSFPKFVTLSHIQNIIETEVSSRLDKVILALERIENQGTDQSVTFTAFEEVVELDIADIYLLDGAVHALRGTLKLLCARDLDLFSPNTTNYTWIGEIGDLWNQIDYDDYSHDTTIYRLNSTGDSLDIIEYNGTRPNDLQAYQIMYNVIEYNLNRASFGSIRKANHTTAYNDFRAITAKLTQALDALDAETDSQEDDLIKASHIGDLDAEMVDIEQMMLDEGITNALASKFKNPRTLIAFVDEILSGPFDFQETVNGYDLDITVDLRQFFINPVDNIKEYLPFYKLKGLNNILMLSEDNNPYTSTYPSNRIYIYADYSETKIEIPSNLIATDTIDSYGNRTITLTAPYANRTSYYNYETFLPFEFLDNQNNPIAPEDMLDILVNGEVPYFADYTFNGVFPGMTRTKWNTQMSNFMDAL